jgi:hypothetical protein
VDDRDIESSGRPELIQVNVLSGIDACHRTFSARLPRMFLFPALRYSHAQCVMNGFLLPFNLKDLLSKCPQSG